MNRLGLRRELFGFVLVGGVGFLVDATLVLLLSQYMNVYLARLLSFAVALTVTWLLNRSWVFTAAGRSARARAAEYSRYVVVQCSGAAVNLAVFSLLIFLFEILKSWLLIPLAAGSLVGMFVNYYGMRVWVFAMKKE